MSKTKTYEDLPPEEFKATLIQMVDWFSKNRKPDDGEDYDIRNFASAASAMSLLREAVEMNAGFYRITIGEYSVKDQDKGDWEITIRQLTPWMKRWRAIQSWPKRVWIWWTHTHEYKSAGEIMEMDNLKELTISIQQPKKPE